MAITTNIELNIILAHPDDESFAFAGVIQRAVAAHYPVQLHVMTSGEKGPGILPSQTSKMTVAKIREKELASAAKILNLSVFLYHLPDNNLENSQSDLRKKIVDIINQNPNALFATTYHQTTSHPDHKTICRTLESLKPKNLFFHYRPDRMTIPPKKETTISLTEHESLIKKQALRCHHSQKKDVEKYLNNYRNVEYYYTPEVTPKITQFILDCQKSSI